MRPVTVVTRPQDRPHQFQVLARQGGEERSSSAGARRMEHVKSTFVTVFEPSGPSRTIKRVAVSRRMRTVVLFIDSTAGSGTYRNLRPGTEQSLALADGKTVKTDGSPCASLIRAHAGGGLSQTASRVVRTRGGRTDRGIGARASATIGMVRVVIRFRIRKRWREHSRGDSRRRNDPRLDPSPRREHGSRRLYVVEEPGFQIDPATQRLSTISFRASQSPGRTRSASVGSIVERICESPRKKICDSLTSPLTISL